MQIFHEKSHRLCSKEYDKEALIAIDLKDCRTCGNVAIEADTKTKIPCPAHNAKTPLPRAVHSGFLSLEDVLLKQDPITGSCRIL